MSWTGLQLCLFSILVYFVTYIVARETILGGKIAKVHDFPYHVALIIHGEDQCGGGIIDDFHVLTAAHCVVGEDGKIIKEHVTIVAGTDKLKNRNEQIVKVQVKKIFVPKEFNIENEYTTGDIAVLKMQHPFDVRKHEYLQALEIPTNENEQHLGKTAKIAGFGWDWVKERIVEGNEVEPIGGNNDTQLHYVEAQVLNDKDCQTGYTYKKIAFNSQFCARVKHDNNGSPSGVCFGDSGGPLVLDGKTVIGILSEGEPTCDEEVSRAGLYTRVVRYQSFIEHARHDRHRDDMATHVYHL